MKRILYIVIPFFIASVFLGCAPQEAKKIGPTIFYPALPQEPRIQFLTSIMTDDDLEKKRSGFDEFLLGERPIMKRIGRPIDIGSTRGRIYISDRLYKKILILDLEKNEFDAIVDSGIGALNDPAGIWVTEDDVKYVTDMGRKQVLVYDRNNDFLRAYGEIDQFEKPVDVALHGERLYVCDLKKNKILVLDKTSGNTIQEIGGIGRDEGNLYKPSYLTLDKEGNLYVTDSFNFRVQMFDQTGKFIRVIGSHGDAPGSFSRPKGLDVSEDRHLYVIDAAFENVQIFDAETARILLFFGGHGGGPGKMALPASLYIDRHNIEYFRKYADKDFDIQYLIIVGNLVSTKRIGVYAFGKWVGAPLTGITKSGTGDK